MLAMKHRVVRALFAICSVLYVLQSVVYKASQSSS
jgi:hypothetical protein